MLVTERGEQRPGGAEAVRSGGKRGQAPSWRNRGVARPQPAFGKIGARFRPSLSTRVGRPAAAPLRDPATKQKRIAPAIGFPFPEGPLWQDGGGIFGSPHASPAPVRGGRFQPPPPRPPRRTALSFFRRFSCRAAAAWITTAGGAWRLASSSMTPGEAGRGALTGCRSRTCVFRRVGGMRYRQSRPRPAAHGWWPRERVCRKPPPFRVDRPSSQ